MCLLLSSKSFESPSNVDFLFSEPKLTRNTTLPTEFILLFFFLFESRRRNLRLIQILQHSLEVQSQAFLTRVFNGEETYSVSFKKSMVLRQDFLRKRRHEEEEKERKERESTRRMRRVSRHYFCCCLKFLETSPNLKSTGEILPICSNYQRR
jgi:hypothetical protein